MIKLIGFPTDVNSSFLRGPALAPPRIRQMDTDGSANSCAEDGTVITAGETYIDLGDQAFTRPSATEIFSTIKTRVARELADGSKLVSLGGDHSVSYPIIDAYSEVVTGLHVLHFDAHGDLYHDFDGNRFSHASPFARIMEQGKVRSLTQVGVRTLTAHQREQAKRFGVHLIEMKDFSTSFLVKLEGPLYVSIDLDVLDPAYAPGVSHHEPGGMTTRELITCLHGIRVSIVGADIVEYNPVRDEHNRTAMVAYKVMKEVMARMLATA